jgi:hypothetical protein
MRTSGRALVVAAGYVPLLVALLGCGTSNEASTNKASPNPDDPMTPSGVDAGPASSSAKDDAGLSGGSAVPPLSLCDAGVTALPTSGVVFAIDLSKGPARQFEPPAGPTAISEYVYGINGFGSLVAKTTRWGLIRQGGDAWSAWNWTNNYQNSGADYCYWEGQGKGGSALAGALTVVSGNGDAIPAAQAKGEAYVLTTPILDHVSATFSNNTGINNLCPGSASCNNTTSSVAVNSGNLDFVSVDPNSTAFVPNAAKKGSAFCLCGPGDSSCSGCTVSTGTVYQDEFANYIKTTYGSGGSPIFFMLDNEPNYWGSTHPELWPFTGTVPCETSTVTYDDVVSRNVSFATAIKTAWPTTKVFGPVAAQDGLIYAHDYASPHWPTEFIDYYLAQMASASASAGQSLLDVLDVHYYNNSSDVASQCVQNPRMFWDPAYTSLSAAATDAVDFGWSGQNNYFDTSWYPRQMIPRLLRKIAAAYTKNAPGLSFSEYNSGCETAIAGAVAQADNLGIFGREGVYAATAWPLQSLTNNYLVAAYDLYRNYDGNGAVVGDTAVSAITTDATDTSVYAFTHSDEASSVEVVAINKQTKSQSVTIAIAHPPALKTASAYDIVDGKAAVAAESSAPTITCTCAACTLSYTLPAMSATTLVLR